MGLFGDTFWMGGGGICLSEGFRFTSFAFGGGGGGCPCLGFEGGGGLDLLFPAFNFAGRGGGGGFFCGIGGRILCRFAGLELSSLSTSAS